MESKEENQIIQVECYSGYKADERPISFILDGNKLMVEEILDRWYSPDCEFFKILADDENRYLLRCNFNGAWILERAFNPYKSFPKPGL
jgi:hypothetical protein